MTKDPLIKRRVLINEDAKRANGEPIEQAGMTATILRRGKVAGRYRMYVDGLPVEISLPMADFTVLPEDATAPLVAAAQGDLRDVHLSEIVPSPTNPRKHTDMEFLHELAASVKALGVLQPIVVRPLPADRLEESFADHMAAFGRNARKPGYEVILGHQRRQAATLAGLRSTRVIVQRMTDSEVLVAQLVENLKRKDLHALEEAEGYQALMDEAALTLEGVAEHVSQTESYVRTRIKLLDLGPEGRQALLGKTITLGLAQLLARVPQPVQPDVCKAFAGSSGKPMTLAEAKEHLKFSHRLAVSDAEPWANAELFEDPAEKARREAEAHAAALADKARERGQEVLEGKAAKAVMPVDGGPMRGYVDIDEVRSINGKEQSLRDALAGQYIKPVVLITETSRALEVMPAAAVGQLLVAVDKKAAKAVVAQAEAPTKAALAEQYERAWRPRAIEALWVEMRDNVEVDSDMQTLRQCGHALAKDLTADQRSLFARLYGLGDVAVADGIRDAIRDDDDIVRLLMLLVMIKDLQGRGPVVPGAPHIEAVAEDLGRLHLIKDAQKAIKAEMTAAARQQAEPTATQAGKPGRRKITAEEAAAGIAQAMQQADGEKGEAAA